MGLKSTIEWTEATWNPVTGCTKVSTGCKHCYAERLAMRLCLMGQPRYENGFRLTLHYDALTTPLSWKKPMLIFVNSMSDLFHEDVPTDFILKVFDLMRRASWHQFQILTKRSQRLAELDHIIEWPDNVWMGVTIENADYSFRLDDLRNTGAHVKFLSLEPLLGPIIDLNIADIQWVIVGGESGPNARPLREEWVISMRDQCRLTGVPFFFKQWGGPNKKAAGRTLQGNIWAEYPPQMRLAFSE
jgi:protein gp37